MDLLNPWGLGLAGVAVALVALAVFNPLAAAKLASALAGFVLDLLRRLVDWARNPRRNWCRIIGVTGGLGCMVLALGIMDARRQLEAVEAQCRVDLAGASAERDGAKALAEGHAATVTNLRARLARETERGIAVDRMAQDAVELAKATQARADLERATWQKGYQDKPRECSVALAHMEVACASIKSY